MDRNALSKVKEGLTATFQQGVTLPYAYRQHQLKQLLKCLRDHQEGILSAMQADFKGPTDALLEWKRCVAETQRSVEMLKTWMEPQDEQLPGIMALDGRAKVEWQPRGVCLIMGAWNYPLDLLIEPLVGAIAAGCCAMLKPSERAPRTAELLIGLMPEYLDHASYAWVWTEEAQWLSSQPWDLIFFTGSSQTGQKVLQQAASSLTPCLLELGGCCPAIVCADADLELAAKRIIWAKLLNAGQTCIAPNHVLADTMIVDQLIAAMIKAVAEMEPMAMRSQLVDQAAWDRLQQLAKMAGDWRYQETDGDGLRMGLKIIKDPPQPAFTQEMFGPILPVFTFSGSPLVEHGKPLAIYLFSASQKHFDHLLTNTQSGSVTWNDCLMQAILPCDLPFGGIGTSGHGGVYHGIHSHRAFSYPRAVLQRSNRFVSLDHWLRMPPMDEQKEAWQDRLLWGLGEWSLKSLAALGLGAALLATAALKRK